MYRHVLALRRERQLGTGELTMLDLGDDLIAFNVVTSAGTTRVVTNLGTNLWPIPSGLHLLAHSLPNETTSVPTDTTAWLSA